MPGISDAVSGLTTVSPLRSSTDPTRFFGAVDGAVAVKLTADPNVGSFSADAALDSFKPPLSAAAFAGMYVKIGMPPNSADAVPASIVQKNGKPYLHVELPSAQVAGLSGAPIIVAVGEQQSLAGKANAPKFILQVNAQQLSVDRTQPMLGSLATEEQSRDTFLSSAQTRKAQMLDGTSNWFPNMSKVQTDRDRAAAQLATNATALAGTQAAVEKSMASALDVTTALMLPNDPSIPRDALTAAATDAQNQQGQVNALQQRRDQFAQAGVPDQVAPLDAQLATLKPQADAASASVHAQLTGLYAKLRTDNPDLADRWLRTFATATSDPNAQNLVNQLAQRSMLQDTLRVDDKNLSDTAAMTKANLPGELANVDSEIAEGQKEKAVVDAELDAVKKGTSSAAVQTFTTTYDPGKKFI